MPVESRWILTAASLLSAFLLLYLIGMATAPPQRAVAADDDACVTALADARANVARYQAALADPDLQAADRGEATQQLHVNEAALRQGCTPTSPPSTSTATPPATTTPAPPTTTSPPVTTTSAPPTTTSPPPGPQACPPFPAMPDAACTGVPAGMALRVYTGPCSLTTPDQVLDGLLINCARLTPRASGIVIRNSRIVGTVNGLSCPSPASPASCDTPRFTIVDSEIQAPQAGAVEVNALGEDNFTALRVEVTGGNRGVYCRINCELRDSWVHGTNIAAGSGNHASAVRQSQGARIIHNRLHCSAPDSSNGTGCSADLTGYGDFEPVANNLVANNLFVATVGGACAYGGSSGDAPGAGHKQFGPDAHDIVFRDNVFERGSNGQCGAFFPDTDFLHSDGTLPPGNLWTGNVWNNGGTVPANS
jgi:hypothetical protein